MQLMDLKMFYTSGERGRLKGRDCRDKGLLENIFLKNMVPFKASN